MDQSKKTMRHFYCRDVLWETFEQMANDFDCSIDYLVNEAMRYYARSKNYQSPGAPGGNATIPPPAGNGSANNGAQANHFANNAPPKPMPRPNAQTSSPPLAPMGMGANGANASMGSQRRPAPPTPGYSARAANPNNTAGPTSHMPSSVPHAAPSPMPPPASNPPPMTGVGPTLFLIYNGQRYPVTKDQFIIGRGSKTSDLPIKDGNISRKHAAVIRRNGTFYIKDLGSTNGIDYKGMRIDNKRIDEGDVFHLCDYELRFTYRADG
jgi:hypothetical protein